DARRMQVGRLHASPGDWGTRDLETRATGMFSMGIRRGGEDLGEGSRFFLWPTASAASGYARAASGYFSAASSRAESASGKKFTPAWQLLTIALPNGAARHRYI